MNQEEIHPGRFQCIPAGDAVKFIMLDTATGEWKIYTLRSDPPKCMAIGKFETDEPSIDRSRRL